MLPPTVNCRYILCWQRGTARGARNKFLSLISIAILLFGAIPLGYRRRWLLELCQQRQRKASARLISAAPPLNNIISSTLVMMRQQKLLVNLPLMARKKYRHCIFFIIFYIITNALPAAIERPHYATLRAFNIIINCSRLVGKCGVPAVIV